MRLVARTACRWRARRLAVLVAAVTAAACSVESDGAGGGGAGEGGGGGEAACVDAPEPCGEDVGCCEGSVCVMAGDDVACRPRCTEDTECETGCCALLIGGGTACLAVDYCAVAP